MEVSGEGSSRSESAVGLHHVAFKIGTTLDEPPDAKVMLDSAGVATTPVDHGVTKSLYFVDLDGNGVEVYVDVSGAWRGEPQRIGKVGPLALQASGLAETNALDQAGVTRIAAQRLVAGIQVQVDQAG